MRLVESQGCVYIYIYIIYTHPKAGGKSGKTLKYVVEAVSSMCGF